MSNKYDLTILGFDYKGVASSNESKKINVDGWEITNIPDDSDIKYVEKFIREFISDIVAIEIPTSLVCNLRCNYCYISDPRMKNKDVDEKNVNQILELSSQMFPSLSKDKKIRQRNNKKTKVYFSAWGAEPFTNTKTLNSLYEFGHEYYGKNEYEISLSTNGTILNDNVKKIISNIIDDNAFQSIQISLDGPEYLQNHQRPFLNKKGSFDAVKNFCSFLLDLQREKELKSRLYSFCSTIHLIDDNFSENWRNAAKFFSEPNTWHTALPVLPMRMSGEDLSNKNHINKFIYAQKEIFEVIKERAKQGVTVLDFYSNKIFGNISCRSKNAFPYCSALNTQIAVDIDGNLYPCHGPITSPLYKPFLYFGNLFEKTISYKQLMRNMNYQYGILWGLGKCEKCPLHVYGTGNICWSCPPHNLALTGEPSMDSPLKCVAYAESFKYWIAIAKMAFGEQHLEHIPNNEWFNDIEVNYNEFKNKILVKNPHNNMHFDMNYNGIIDKALQRYEVEEKYHNYGDKKYISSWWDFDNFKNIK